MGNIGSLLLRRLGFPRKGMEGIVVMAERMGGKRGRKFTDE